MKPYVLRLWPLATAVLAIGFAAGVVPDSALAQVSDPAIEEVVVTGTRIRRNPLNEPTPVLSYSEEDMEKSGLTNLGDMLQRLPISTSAINTRFNVPGNSGFPQDGTGIGAGASQIALRNLGARRTLVLVDGRRFVPGASASGHSTTARPQSGIQFALLAALPPFGQVLAT